jgi:hypothetical protein
VGTASARRLGLLDALLLVAGIGVGLAVTRAYLTEHNAWLSMSPFQSAPPARFTFDWTLNGLVRVKGGIVCMSMALCLTQLILRFRSRPVRSLATGIGTSACLASCTALAIWLLLRLCWLAAKAASGTVPSGILWWQTMVDEIETTPAVAVVAVWVVLWLGRGSARPWDWIELFGAFLGCVLILQVFVEPIVVALI